MPKYAEPESSPELRDAISKLISASGLSEAEASRKLGYSAPSQLNRRLNEGKPAFTRDEIERICDEFTLGPEQRVELLRLRGDVVIVQPGQSVQVVAIEQLHAALTMLLSQTLRTELEPLLALLTDALRGVIPWAMLRERAAQAPQVAFDHAQMGDVSIGAVAGRDVITIGTLQLLLPPPSSPPPPPLSNAMLTLRIRTLGGSQIEACDVQTVVLDGAGGAKREHLATRVGDVQRVYEGEAAEKVLGSLKALVNAKK